MPFLTTPEATLYYRTAGSRDRPALVLVNSLGTTLEMWQPQQEAFAAHFFVITFDARGHGQSSVPAGPYTIAQMGADVLALLDALELPRVHLCGLSLGGMVGQWLGIHAPARLDRLILSNTAAQIGTPAGWNARIEQVETGGMASIADAVIARWFTPAFIAAEPAGVDRVAAMLRATTVAGYAASCAAIRDMDQRAEIHRITAPTLIIAGAQDQVTPLSDSEYLAHTIPNARMLTLPAAHLANIEAAGQFTQAALQFLQEGEANGR